MRTQTEAILVTDLACFLNRVLALRPARFKRKCLFIILPRITQGLLVYKVNCCLLGKYFCRVYHGSPLENILVAGKYHKLKNCSDVRAIGIMRNSIRYVNFLHMRSNKNKYNTIILMVVLKSVRIRRDLSIII